jgi:hypothetical protein
MVKEMSMSDLQDRLDKAEDQRDAKRIRECEKEIARRERIHAKTPPYCYCVCCPEPTVKVSR